MLVSADQLSNYNIPSDFWFPSRASRNTYFSENAAALISGIYCAIADSEEDYIIGLFLSRFGCCNNDGTGKETNHHGCS